MKKIISTITLGLFLIGCSDNAQIESNKQEVNKKESRKVKEKKQEPTTNKVIKTSNNMKTTPALTRNGKEIFMTCTACHGKSAEKEAMGKSKIIQGWETKKIINALKGYKNDSYGGPMKTLMKAQVAKLSDVDIQKVSEYISSL